MHVVGKPITPTEMSLKERLMSWIMDPNVAFILLALGGLALWAEFNHPGAVIPGVVGLIAVLLAVFALNLLPTRFAAIALLLAAFVLFALEAKFARHGVLGAGGIVCMIIGAMFLVDGPHPGDARPLPDGTRRERSDRGDRGVPDDSRPPVAPASRRNGERGNDRRSRRRKDRLGPEGKVFVHGELWNATATSTLASGTRVRVRAVDGLHLRVEPAE